MEFRVLGPIEILENGRNIAPTAPKPRQVISLLMLRRNGMVRTTEFIDELWENGPPASAMTTLQTYIYKLRKIFVEHGAGDVLSTRPGGYLLTVPDSSIDLARFEQAAGEGQALLEAGHPARAADVLAGALARWRGPALVDVVPGGLLSSYVTALEESRSRTLELRIEADLQLGRHRELISELKSLILTHPLHEHRHASLMIALYRSGRRHEALEVYRVLRHNMIEELGLEPGRELTQLHQALLSGATLDPPLERRQLAVPPPREGIEITSPARPRAGAASPAQLPADVADFTARTAVIEEIMAGFAVADDSGASRTATRMAIIAGMPGVGKTTLAIHLAHKLRPQFEDGQLYVELRASTGMPVDVDEALHGMLQALGVPESQIPDEVEERSKLFRSATAGRHLLVVIDDVSSLADVRRLLPGDPQCAVIITSCRRLHGLAGARNVDLDVMEHGEAIELLARMIGNARVRQEWQAADKLVQLAGQLPFALRCISSRLATMRGLSLAGLAEHLTRSRQMLDELWLGELDVRSRYDRSYDGLSRMEQGMFRFLSMLPTTEFTAEVAAGLLGWEIMTVERALERFVDNFLIRIVRCDSGEICYAFPKLTWIYARERLTSALAGDQDECASIGQVALHGIRFS